MVTLSLKPEDAGTLKAILEEYLSDLRMEIADTDSMDFRNGLKRKKALLEKLSAQLDGGAAG